MCMSCHAVVFILKVPQEILHIIIRVPTYAISAAIMHTESFTHGNVHLLTTSTKVKLQRDFRGKERKKKFNLSSSPSLQKHTTCRVAQHSQDIRRTKHWSNAHLTECPRAWVVSESAGRRANVGFLWLKKSIHSRKTDRVINRRKGIQEQHSVCDMICR